MAILVFIFFVVLGMYGVLIDRFRRDWHRIPIYRGTSNERVHVTVIIAARNEQEKLPRLLHCLSNQDYPQEFMQLLICDDHSTDNTVGVARAFGAKVMCLSAGEWGKKAAIAAGVKAATGELIITTDADCTMRERWVSTMVSAYKATGAEMLAAPVRVESGRSLLDIFQALDFLMMQGITGAAVSQRHFMMCNGANLAYRRSAYTAVNGFEGVDKLPSGDDMFLMQKVYEQFPEGVVYVKDEEAIVNTDAEPTFRMFLQQRIRWASKSAHYSDRKIFYTLLLTYVVNALFVVCTLLLWWYPQLGAFLLMAFVVKNLVEFPFVNAVAIFFGQRWLAKYVPFLQPLHIIYILVAGWLGHFGSYSWKQRTIKKLASESPAERAGAV